LKEKHWDAHITPGEDSKDTWVGPIRLKEYLKPNKWDLETGIHLEKIRKYDKVWVLLEAPTHKEKKLGPIRQPVGRQSFEVVNRAWVSCHENRLETLVKLVANAKADAKVSNHASNRSNFRKMLTSFEEVLTVRALHTLVSMFLNDPVAQLTDGNHFAFLHGEQEWPQYNKGEGGADLIFSPNASTKRVTASSTSECIVPKQVVIFHAAKQSSFYAGSAPNGKRSVNVAKSNNFFLCANPNNRFCQHYDNMVPLYAWPTASQLPLGRDDVRRPEIGGQGMNRGETVTVEVQNWKDVSGTGSKKSLLTRLNQSLKKDKAVRNDLDFKIILKTLKKLQGTQDKIFLLETKAVNILPIPGYGDCFPQACTLSIMLSADPAHGALLYNTLFPQPLRFTQLHRYVFKDNLCGCARFWFARWCCQKQDVRAILEQSLRQSVFAQDLEGNGLSRRMKIADFLNLIARNSDQIEAGMSHFFYTKLMHYFVEFLQEVLSIKITLLILTSGKDNTLFLHEGSTTELKSDHFLVLVREGGQNTSSSHYRPLLLDYQLEKVWQSCGLLKYKDLPTFVIALLEHHQTTIVLEILHNVGHCNDPAPTHKLLFSEDRLSKNLFLWRVALMVNNGQNTKELGKTVICGPLYSLGLLGPYLECERNHLCMQMFQSDMTPGHNKNCATVLQAMACLLKALLQTLETYATPTVESLPSIFDPISLVPWPKHALLYLALEKQRDKMMKCSTIVHLKEFVENVEKIVDDAALVDWFCISFEGDPAKLARSFAGIPSCLFWALYSSLIDRPIVVLDDVLSTWDSQNKGLDDDMTGHRFFAIGKLMSIGGAGVWQCNSELLRKQALKILPKYLNLMKDPQSTSFSKPVASDALSAIIRNSSCKLDEGEPCGCRDANGDWKLSIYAQNSFPDSSIILSSSSFCSSGFMPVLTKTYLDSSCSADGIFADLAFEDLKVLVSNCKNTLAKCDLWNEEAFQDLIFSFGYTGQVGMLPPVDDAVALTMRQFCLHVKKLAQLTRQYLQDEVDMWLALGGDHSKVTLLSNATLRGNVLKQWFLSAQVCFSDIIFSEIPV
jgi:hypothetical protein